MNKLLFVDHSFHAKTRATIFLQELLAQHFDVRVVWDERWAGGPAIDPRKMNAENPDAIVFFQSLPRPRALRQLECPNLIWIPMRDGLHYDSSRLRKLHRSSLKILNFCQETHAYFSAKGHQSLTAQYWPPATATAIRPQVRGPRLFFWPRRHEITWDTLKTLLGTFRPESIVLRYAPDPKHQIPLPSQDDIREFKITLVQGWLEHDAYLNLLRHCELFMAPRPQEGIGQAMLEAMSHGLAILAPNAPTMNEYVRDGHNGWLYDLNKPEPLDFSGWAERCSAAYADTVSGHNEWLSQAESLAAFVAAPGTKKPSWDWRLLQSLHI